MSILAFRVFDQIRVDNFHPFQTLICLKTASIETRDVARSNVV